MDQEISISDILEKLWKRRGIIAVTAAVSVLLSLTWIIATKLQTQSPVTYFVSLRNIDNEKYPNGAMFSPKDLLIPQVVSEIQRRFGIVSSSRILDNVDVEFNSPMTSAVSRKYREKLMSKSLGQTEIDGINAAYRNELQAMMHSGLRIDVNYVGLGVERAVGQAIATDLPRIWSDVYSTQFRIFNDTQLQSVGVTQTKETLETASSVLVSTARLANIEHGLRILSSDNRLSSLATEAGYSAEDLLEDLRRYRTIYFNPVFAAAFKEPDPVSVTYLRERNLSIGDLERQVAGLDNTLSDLREHQRAGQRGGHAEAMSANPCRLATARLARLLISRAKPALPTMSRRCWSGGRSLCCKSPTCGRNSTSQPWPRWKTPRRCFGNRPRANWRS